MVDSLSFLSDFITILILSFVPLPEKSACAVSLPHDGHSCPLSWLSSQFRGEEAKGGEATKLCTVPVYQRRIAFGHLDRPD
ncbi:unnamed protein product [Calypogeia fissa]